MLLLLRKVNDSNISKLFLIRTLLVYSNMNEKILSVTDITRQIKGVLELGFTNIHVQGELSNCKLHSSGHLYFTLKDDLSQISGVMWRSRVQQLVFRPSDGMKIIARGNISVYEPRGSYQLDCLQLQPLGIGELQKAFEKLKQRLLQEGLFDDSRKRVLPMYPTKIGIITSPTGAAIHDIHSVLSRRMPSLEVILMPVKVQGIGAAEDIAQAIRDLNAYGDLDVIIVGRGGGSLEDLWAFNEEIVARSICDSKIPVISAVGHEVDFTICDFVADLRAPTPSAAAEIVVKDRTELIEYFRNICYTMTNSMINMIGLQRQSIEYLIHSYSFNRPQDMIKQRNQRVDDLIRRLGSSSHHILQTMFQTVREYRSRLNSLNPDRVLKRGYAIVRQNGVIVSNIAAAREETISEIIFYDGIISATIHSKQAGTNGKKRK